MKRTVRLSSLIFVLMLTITIGVNAQTKSKRQPEPLRYEIENVGTEIKGIASVKVWTYSKEPKISVELAKRNAVHGIIFKGVSGMKAWAEISEEDTKKAFFDKFFAVDGDYGKYVSVSGDGETRAEDRIKIGKEYKIGINVSVKVKDLRKALVAGGIKIRNDF